MWGGWFTTTTAVITTVRPFGNVVDAKTQTKPTRLWVGSFVASYKGVLGPNGITTYIYSKMHVTLGNCKYILHV